MTIYKTLLQFVVNNILARSSVVLHGQLGLYVQCMIFYVHNPHRGYSLHSGYTNVATFNDFESPGFDGY